MRPPACHALLFTALLLSSGFGAALAQTPPPQGVLNLSASASVEVTRDLLAITFSTTRDGADAAAVQAQLKQALDAALAEAKRVARPGLVDVQTGNFSLYPRYAPKGGINGWQGSAELVVEGRDIAAISQLAGRIGTLTVARVGYSLSREVREKAEAEVSAQAIARYRAKAADYARQFGYAGYALRDVSVNANEAAPPRPMALQSRMLAASSEEALPVEAGKASVTVVVNGSVQLQ